jgi:hypothetical protein
MMSAQQQRGAMRRSGSVNAESPTLPRMRRQQRQAILAPTRVAPTPALVVPIATRQAARDDPTAIVPPQYTLAPLVLPPKQPADSAVEAREATTTAFLACMDEMGRVRDKVNVATKAADSHVREVSRELSTEHGNNAAQLREVDSKLDKSETVAACGARLDSEAGESHSGGEASAAQRQRGAESGPIAARIGADSIVCV